MRLDKLMERRMNPRKPLCLTATVRYPGEGGGGCIGTVSRNLSYEGAFVEARALSGLHGSIVRVELETSSHGRIDLDALVLRETAVGLGLMFAYYSTEAFERLDDLLASETGRRRTAGAGA